ncbi:MAG: inhibitor of KinA, partial [Verrucomicrobiota bacterium]
MEITPLGDSGLILRVRETFEDAPDEALNEVLGFFDFLRHADLPGVTELVPAYTTVAIYYDAARVVAAGGDPKNVFEWLGGRIQTEIANGQLRLNRSTGSAIEIPV